VTGGLDDLALADVHELFGLLAEVGAVGVERDQVGDERIHALRELRFLRGLERHEPCGLFLRHRGHGRRRRQHQLGIAHVVFSLRHSSPIDREARIAENMAGNPPRIKRRSALHHDFTVRQAFFTITGRHAAAGYSPLPSSRKAMPAACRRSINGLPSAAAVGTTP
jgi:hypothetical protein